MGELSVLSAVLGESCQTDFDTQGGFVLWAALVLYTFYVLAGLCDGHLTGVLEKIVEKLGIPEDVAGATFLAMSSSAPELFCSIVSTFVLVSSSGVGNIVGSALFNLLVIIGVLPVFARKEGGLKIWWYPTARDAFFYALAIAELWWVVADGLVVWWEAAVMCASYLVYVAYFFVNGRICARFGLAPPADEAREADEKAGGGDAGACGASPPAEGEAPAARADGEFVVTLGPCAGGLAGVKLVPSSHPEALEVKEISTNSADLVPAWNALHVGTPLAVRSGDRVVAVNGVSGPVAAIVELKRAIKEAEAVQLTIARGSQPREVIIGKVDMDKESDASTATTKASTQATSQATSLASSRRQVFRLDHEKAQEEIQEKPCKASLAMQAIKETLSGSSGSKDGSLKGVLPDVEAAKGEDEEDDEAPRRCPADPSGWVVDRTMRPVRKWTSVAFAVVVFWVAVFTYVMVDGAGRLGCVFGVPHVIMGFVVLAAGTSVPDMIASIAVAREGLADMAAANAVGSNTFDILLGLGAPWLIGALMGREIRVPAAQLTESIVILAGCLAAYVTALCLSGFRLTRRLGAAMVLVYVGAIAFTLVRHYTHYGEGHA